jgi:hypothetical protein
MMMERVKAWERKVGDGKRTQGCEQREGADGKMKSFGRRDGD